MIEFDNDFVKIYTKKIFGFAFSKTHNIQQSEDLSQDILIALADSLKRQNEIADLSGFVYTICCYTWSMFLRKNKKHWNNLDISNMFSIKDNANVEQEVEKNITMTQLKTEIAYLTKIHRQITIMFYYENKTGDEIAKFFKISHSTVRWHLVEIRKN